MPSLFSQHDSLMLHVKMFTPLSNNLSLIMIFFSFSVPRFHISQKTKKQTNKKTRNQNWENKVSQLTGRDEKQRGKKEEKKYLFLSPFLPDTEFPRWELRNSLSDCLSAVILCCMFKLQNRTVLTMFYIPKLSQITRISQGQL